MDQFLFSWINSQATSPVLDRWMATLSCLDFWVPLLVLAAAGTAVWGKFRGRAMLLVLVATVGLTDGVFVNGLKHWANRPRPHQVEEARVVDLARTKPRVLAAAKPLVVRISNPEPGVIAGRSFPSGHTADNFAAAAVLALFFRRWGWTYFVLAAGVGYSRVYVGAHWPSDVAVSMFLGTGLGVLGVALAEGAWRRWGMRVAPGWRGRHASLLGKETEPMQEKVAV